MSVTTRTLTLNNGIAIPVIGSGCGPNNDDFSPEGSLKTKQSLLEAIKAGYRHFDGALLYGTEKVFGEALRESGVPREEFFITTKFPFTHHGHVEESLNTSLELLGVDYVDLFLMHWPQSLAYKEPSDAPPNPWPHSLPFLKCDPFPVHPDGTSVRDDSTTFIESYAQMEKLLAAGKTRAIGVSNFTIQNLEKLLPTVKVVPAVNQIETHPYSTEEKLVAYCQEKGIVIEAYTPGGRGELRSDPVILDLASKYGVSANQVILAWHVARGTVALPKSANPDRIKQNLELPVLDAEDVKKVFGLNKNQRAQRMLLVNGTIFGWTPEQLGWYDLVA